MGSGEYKEVSWDQEEMMNQRFFPHYTFGNMQGEQYPDLGRVGVDSVMFNSWTRRTAGDPKTELQLPLEQQWQHFSNLGKNHESWFTSWVFSSLEVLGAGISFCYWYIWDKGGG